MEARSSVLGLLDEVEKGMMESGRRFVECECNARLTRARLENEAPFEGTIFPYFLERAYREALQVSELDPPMGELLLAGVRIGQYLFTFSNSWEDDEILSMEWEKGLLRSARSCLTKAKRIHFEKLNS